MELSDIEKFMAEQLRADHLARYIADIAAVPVVSPSGTQWYFEFSLNEIFLLFIEMCPLVGIIIGIALFYISIISELKCT